MTQRIKKYSLSDLHFSAEVNNGKCLSKEYVDVYTPVEWRCEKGHRFSLAHRYVRQGAWCSQCEKENKKQDRLQNLILLAKVKSGELVSKTYINANTKYKWKCNDGHIFEALYSNIKKRHWCKKCSTIARQKKEFASIKKVIEKKHAKCLSETYINAFTKIKIKCSSNHIFIASAGHIKLGHSWCPYCSRKSKHTINEFKDFAKSKNGKCISDTYVNNNNLLIWQCEKKHIWENTGSHVLDGQWCPECRKTNLSERYRTDIKVIQKLAKEKGGKLLSKEYINANINLQWQCGKGHVWLAKYGQVKYKTWCPVCAVEKRRQGVMKVEKEGK